MLNSSPPRQACPFSSSYGSELLIGLLVPPVLGGILIAQGLADGLIQAGLVSEQIFRGERLPNLNMAADSNQ